MLVLTAGGGVGRCLTSEDLTDVREEPRGEQHAGPREQDGHRHEAAVRQCVQGAGHGPARPGRMSSWGRAEGHRTLGGHNKDSQAVAGGLRGQWGVLPRGRIRNRI